jgi:hypothetical protein
VQAVLTLSWHAPPVAIEFCKQVVQAVLAVTGGDLQSVSAQSVAHGLPPSAPVPMHAQASSTVWNVA